MRKGLDILPHSFHLSEICTTLVVHVEGRTCLLADYSTYIRWELIKINLLLLIDFSVYRKTRFMALIIFVWKSPQSTVSYTLVPQLGNHLLREVTSCMYIVMTSHDACTSGTSRVLTVASLQRLKEALVQLPWLWSAVFDKVLNAHSNSADRNSLTWTRIRRVPSSYPSADQTDWVSFRGYPQSFRQMVCWIYITTINLTMIHKIHKLQILTQWKFARGPKIWNECHTVVAIPGGRFL